MDFEFTDEQKMLRDNARRFVEKEIMPVADALEKENQPLPKDLTHQLIKKLVPLGYLSVFIPEEAGGDGLGYVAWGILYEELSRAWVSLAMIAQSDGNCALRIATTGTEEQKRRFLPGLLSGDKIGCGAATEPNVGSDASAVEAKAVRQGDFYVLNGTKTWITNGSVCDMVVVTSQREEGTEKDTSRFIVEKAVSPFEARDIHKLGVRACSAAELSFADCKVPADNRLVDTAGGHAATLRIFNMARAQVSIICLGLGQAAIEAAVKYAKERFQFGRPIGKFQLVQEMIADMVTDMDASRLLAYRSCQLLDKDVRSRRECSVAKLFTTQAAERVTSQALQIHGAYGLSDEYPVERYFRDARVFTIPDGTTQIQKLIIGREVLGMSAIT